MSAKPLISRHFLSTLKAFEQKKNSRLGCFRSVVVRGTGFEPVTPAV